MAALSKSVYSTYSSQFFKIIELAGLCIVIVYVIFDIINASLSSYRVITAIWATTTYMVYFLSLSPLRISVNKSHFKYIMMWMVLLSQILLALYVTSKC